ncbi:AAA family ATPase [Rhodanobacter sp. OK091]|uniref:AAA family ATPase n=1 Tax=Rhodanobacter sp. OK091 TaxID=1881037 RepID=UPI00091ADD9B|nr:AAA family ATPase [Rhodanobacter sp. OK091]SHL78395.1 AAA domain-containing protein [Rhodanobacter sp. OK091]
MRFQTFEATAYGKFDLQKLEFPAAPSVLLVYGPNEAGKSSMRQAIVDFLFGVPLQTSQAYLHPRPGIILAADVLVADQSLRVTRNTKRRDSLTVEGQGVFDEATWLARLGGIDRATFERLFALGRDELVAGAREMLDPDANASRTLFEAAAGLTTYTEMSRRLNDEAAEAYSSRRQSTAFAKAKERFELASASLRQHEHKEPAYRVLQKARSEAQRQLEEIDSDRRAKRAYLTGRTRIARTLPQLRDYDELESQLASTEPMVVGNELRTEVTKGYSERQTLSERRAGLVRAQEADERDRNTISVRPEVVAAAPDVKELELLRSQALKTLEDIPKRIAQREQLRPEIEQELAVLGMAGESLDGLYTRLPTLAQISAIAAAATAMTELETRRRDLSSGHEAAVETQAALLADIAELSAEDPEPLRRCLYALETTANLGELRARRDQLAVEASSLTERRVVLGLSPEDLDAEFDPPKEAVAKDIVREQRKLAESVVTQGRLVEECEDTRVGLEARLAEMEQSDIPSLDALMQLRRERDSALDELISNGSPDAVAVSKYRPLVTEADALSDRRFDKASAAHELDSLRADHVACMARAKAARAAVESAKSKQLEVVGGWESLCQAAGLPAVDMENYGSWLSEYRAVRASDTAHRSRAKSHRKTLDALVPLAMDILGHLALPQQPWGDDPLVPIDAVLTEGKRVLGECEKQQSAAASLKRRGDEGARLLEESAARIAALEAEATKHAKTLREVLSMAGLAETLSAEWARDAGRRIEALRTKAREFHERDEARINPMRRDLDKYENKVRELAARIGEPTVGSWQAMLESLVTLSESHVALARKHETIEERMGERQLKLNDVSGQLKEMDDQLQAHYAQLEVADFDEFSVLANARDEWDRAVAARDEKRRTLMQAEDGRSIETLRSEAEGVDADDLMVEIDALNQEVEGIETRYGEAVAALRFAEKAVDGVTPSDAAVLAMSERASATLAWNRALDEHVRCLIQQQLLDWAIGRFREDHQSPLVAAAERYLQIVTCGAHTRLLVDDSNPRNPQLLVLGRDSQMPRTMAALSEGTRDQLYLALRLAGLELHLDEGRTPLPFVADDLFVNFDDTRAAAGFTALGELARRTQVVYFTHHQHLTDLAQATLGNAVTVARLS